ncbi:MAG TPA: methyltransferase domain-containing protein [Candidatus Acidoferrales bacterium]|nr:methyltransferase domain-containing protein [Candidatus Acidoferrales bacterium]
MTIPSKAASIYRIGVFLSCAAALVLFASLLFAQDAEWAKRDAWQRPAEVMDALGAKAGSVVADVGAGPGYFTFRLAERVGPSGKVYAEDILKERLDSIRERAAKENLPQITTILGETDNPRLPANSLDAVLIMNAYHEFRDYDAMLQGIFRALKPGGFFAVIDDPADPGQPRESYYSRHHIPKEMVRGDLERNGFHFLRELAGFTDPDGGRSYFFLLYEKQKTP